MPYLPFVNPKEDSHLIQSIASAQNQNERCRLISYQSKSSSVFVDFLDTEAIRVDYHLTASRSLRSLRLTSRYIGALATELLFQSCTLVVGDTESWLRIHQIANHQEIAKYLKLLNIVDYAWIGSPCLWVTGGFDLAMLPEINSITIFNALRASRSPAKNEVRAEACSLPP